MKHGAQTNICQICHLRPGNPVGWCRPCRESYDRAKRTDDGTVLSIISIIMWGAKRARRFALAQRTRRRK
jgi:hypothetical protein